MPKGSWTTIFYSSVFMMGVFWIRQGSAALRRIGNVKAVRTGSSRSKKQTK